MAWRIGVDVARSTQHGGGAVGVSGRSVGSRRIRGGGVSRVGLHLRTCLAGPKGSDKTQAGSRCEFSGCVALVAFSIALSLLWRTVSGTRSTPLSVGIGARRHAQRTLAFSATFRDQINPLGSDAAVGANATQPVATTARNFWPRKQWPRAPKNPTCNHYAHQYRCSAPYQRHSMLNSTHNPQLEGTTQHPTVLCRVGAGGAPTRTDKHLMSIGREFAFSLARVRNRE